MNEVGSGVAVNILSSAIWALVGAAAVALYTFYRARRTTAFNRFAQMPSTTKLVHLTYGLVGPDAATRSVQEGDVSSICSALALLNERFGNKKVLVLSPTAALTEFGSVDNLLSISGPVWNPVSGALLSGSPIAVGFGSEGTEDVLIDEVGTVRHTYRTVRDSGIPRECYALVYRGSRETSADKTRRHFVVAAGISALGTYGAVTWLRKCSHQPVRHYPFAKALHNDQHAVIVLRIRDNSPEGFQAYLSAPNTPGFLGIDVLHQYKTDPKTRRVRQLVR